MDNVVGTPNEISFSKKKIGKIAFMIGKIKKFKTKYNISAEQNRYIDKIVRRDLGLQTQKRKRRLPNYLTPAEIHTFINHIRTKGIKQLILAKLLLSTGLRVSEASKLDIRDIDFNGNQLKVVEGKGKKDRYVPLTTSVMDQLKQFVIFRSKGNIFFNEKNGKPYSIRTLQLWMETSLKECNFNKHLSTHSLRHTFACFCMNQGLSLEQIQLLMGHSSRVTTEIYARLELGSTKDQFLSIMRGI